MNKHTVKRWSAGLLPVVMMTTGMACADTLKAALGESSAATDFYRVTCSANTAGATERLSVSLIDLAPVAGPMVSAQVVKGPLGKNTTDAVDGDDKASPQIAVKGGNGVYDVRVNKTAQGAELYRLDYRCLSSAGNATKTAITTIQNQ